MNSGLLPGVVRSPGYYQELHVGVPSSTSFSIENLLSMLGDYNDYFGPIVNNMNAGTTASTDIVFTNDKGNSGSLSSLQSTYGDLGVNSSANTNSLNTLFQASDMYLFTSGSLNNMNFALATNAGTAIKFAVGGLLTANEVARFTSGGLTVGLAGTLTGAIKLSGSTSGTTTITTANAAAGTLTAPAVTDTLAVLGTAQTFTATQTFRAVNYSNNAVTVTSNAGTCPVSYRLNTFTNSSAATMAVTIATAGAVDGQLMIVRIYDFSAASQTIGWTNTENGTVNVPTSSIGSTTQPTTVGLQFNSQTTKWHCLAVSV